MLVSVIMPAYNAERYVSEAVHSILGQTHEELELIVVDDGSTDRTAAIVDSFRDPRVRLVRQENRGEAAARNHGLDLARGDVVLWQDADDVALPQRAATLLAALHSPTVGFAHSDMVLVDDTGAPLGYLQAAPVPAERVRPFLLRVGTPYNNGSMMVRRRLLTGCRFDTSLRVGADTDMVRQFAPATVGVHVPEPLYAYRRHQSGATAGGGEQVAWPQVRLLLERERPQDLVPEAWRAFAPADDAAAAATAVIALLLLRRGFIGPAVERFEQAAAAPCGPTARRVVAGVVALASGDLDTAAARLKGAGRCALALNYLGEAEALRGDLAGGTRLFQEALRLDPDYYEPVLNLRGSGGAGVMTLVDSSWNRFRAAA